VTEAHPDMSSAVINKKHFGFIGAQQLQRVACFSFKEHRTAAGSWQDLQICCRVVKLEEAPVEGEAATLTAH
jgi:hypothetical protein